MLQDTAVEHVGVGAIAPRLTHAAGGQKAQLHYVKKPSREKYEKLVRVFSFYYLALAHRMAGDLKRKLGFARDRGEIPREIFAPHGAFMIMTREYFSRTGGFAYPCFLFLEEIYIGHECEKAGLSCIYEPRITYAHKNHGTMGSILSRRVVSYLHEAHEAVLPILE
jgi:GT2 family glycosyltransferase